jgi:hypothetical protein
MAGKKAAAFDIAQKYRFRPVYPCGRRVAEQPGKAWTIEKKLEGELIHFDAIGFAAVVTRKGRTQRRGRHAHIAL